MANAVVREIAEQIHNGQCAKCNGPGPVDVCEAHWVYSVVVITSWNTTAELCCRSCGVKKQLGAFAFCFFLGWWGYAGLIVTPVQLIRNLIAMASGPKADKPSARLIEISRDIAAQHHYQEEEPRRHEPDPAKPWRRG